MTHNNSGGGMAKKTIPLNTLFKYEADEAGNIYRDGFLMKPWKHYPPKRQGTNPYYRVRLRIKTKDQNGKDKFFYVQRLMGYTFLDLHNHKGKIVRHGKAGSLDNSLPNLSLGDHEDNQHYDRKKQGTYFARGGNKIDDVKAKEFIEDAIGSHVFAADDLRPDLNADLPF